MEVCVTHPKAGILHEPSTCVQAAHGRVAAARGPAAGVVARLVRRVDLAVAARREQAAVAGRALAGPDAAVGLDVGVAVVALLAGIVDDAVAAALAVAADVVFAAERLP